MKQNVSPAMFIAIIVVALVIVGIVMLRVWVAPSSVRAPGAPVKAVPPSGAIPPEAFKARDEWRKAHPESVPGGGR